MNITKAPPFAYYIGDISVSASNAMLKEIADSLRNYGYSIVSGNPISFFRAVKEDIDSICKRHPRCKPVDLRYTFTPFGVFIYACKQGSDTNIISIHLSEALHQITP